MWFGAVLTVIAARTLVCYDNMHQRLSTKGFVLLECFAAPCALFRVFSELVGFGGLDEAVLTEGRSRVF